MQFTCRIQVDAAATFERLGSPEGLTPPGWYQPVPRGLEIKIGEKLRQLRQWDEAAGKT